MMPSKEELQNMYWNKRMSLWDISAKNNIPYGSLSRHMSHLDIQKRNRLDALREKIMRKLPPRCTIRNPDVGYILGVYYGDGWISGGRILALKVNDYDFAKKFFDTAKRIGFKPNRIRKIKSREQFYTSISSVEFVRFIQKITIGNLYKFSTSIRNQFVMGFFDSEGSVYTSGRYKNVHFANYSKEIMEFIKKTLKDAGIICYLYRNLTRPIHINKKTFQPNQKYIYNLYINRYDSLKKFSEFGKPFGRKFVKLSEIIRKFDVNSKDYYLKV